MTVQTYSGKKINGYLKVLLILLGAIMIGVNLFSKTYYGVGVGMLLVYLSTFEKEVTIVPNGIMIDIKAFQTKHHQMIHFADVSNIRIENIGSKTILHVMQGHLGRKVWVDTHTVSQIVAWAKDKNRKIHVDNIKK
ncbi:hypothetical protein QBE52_04260 [Clostridiaceae bacterium 35-E11]